MPNAITLDEPLERLSQVIRTHSGKLLFAALGLAATGYAIAPPPLDLPAIAAGAALASLAAFALGVTTIRTWLQQASLRDFAHLTAGDPSPCLITDAEGAVGHLNDAARKRFGSAEGGTLVRALGDLFANPSGVLFRLQERAAALGGAREDVITRRGLVRLTVTDTGEARYFWRFEEIADARTPVRGGDTLGLPMLVAAKSGAILYMNETLREAVGGRAKHLDRIIKDLPLRPGEVHELTATDGPRRYRLVEVAATGGRSELYFLPAEIGAADRAPTAGTAASAGIEDLPVGLLELRSDGVIVAANRLARELLRPEGEDDLAGVPLADRLEGLGRPVRDWLDEATKGRGLGRPEVLRVRSQEAEAYLQVTLGRVAGRRGVRLVAVLNDATELKTLEAQFVQSQKMQAIGQLAGGVAHDFNNLLTAISGHCDLMLLRHDQGDPDYGDLVQIHQNANRAAGLVGQLLAFSRKQTLQPQVIDLRDTLADLTHLLNRLVGERISLTLNHEPGLPPIRADRRQLEQVIMNLVVNARDAMPDGGEIRIETATRVLGDELRRDRAIVPPGRYVVVKVEDRGIGIAPDKLSKIFEPFYTSKRVGEGTGLGLSTAYGIVKQSGGFIFVDSVVGSGSVFTLHFPAHDGPADATTQAPVAADPASAATASRAPAQERPRTADPVAARVASAARRSGATALAENLFLEDDEAVEAEAPPPRGPPTDLGRIRGQPNGAPGPVPAGADGCQSGAGPMPERGGTAGLMPSSAADAAVADGWTAAQAPQGPDRPAVKRQGEGVILLVEDEAPVRAFASRALRMRGYTVIEAESAEEALATLEDPALEVDLFLTDVIMPGLDGPSWVRQALETRPDVKVVFVSGYAEDSFGEEQSRIPNSVFLPKPFSLSELTATVQDQIC